MHSCWVSFYSCCGNHNLEFSLHLNSQSDYCNHWCSSNFIEEVVMGKRNSDFIINSHSFYFRILFNCQREIKIKKKKGGKTHGIFWNKMAKGKNTMVKKHKVTLNMCNSQIFWDIFFLIGHRVVL